MASRTGWAQRWRERRRVQIDGIEGDAVPSRFRPEHQGRFSRGWWGLLRTILAVLLALTGALAMVAGISLQWLQDSVVDRDGFAKVSEELAADQSLQEELVATALDNASRSVQQQDLGGIPFGGSILDIVDQRVASGIQEYAGTEQYTDDWNQVVLTTHELNLENAGEGEGQGAPEDLEIGTGPVVDSIEHHIEDRIGFGVDLDLRSQESLGGADGIVVVGDSHTGPTFDTIVDSTRAAPYLLWGGVVAMGLALLLGRHREWAVAAAGAGLIVGVLYARSQADSLTTSVTSSPNLQDVGRTVIERIFEILLTGLDQALTPYLWAGVAALVVGLIAAAARTLWHWGADDGWEDAHTPGDGRRRRVVEV